MPTYSSSSYYYTCTGGTNIIGINRNKENVDINIIKTIYINICNSIIIEL